jgi:hypothetical protein
MQEKCNFIYYYIKFFSFKPYLLVICHFESHKTLRVAVFDEIARLETQIRVRNHENDKKREFVMSHMVNSGV